MWLNPFMDGCQCGYITKLKKKKKKPLVAPYTLKAFQWYQTFFKDFVVAIQI